MIYYILVLIGSALMAFGLILMKRPFFKLAKGSLSLLNIILDNSLDEDSKQRSLIGGVGKVLSSLLLFVGILVASVASAIIPAFIYIDLYLPDPGSADISSWKFYGFMLVGFTLPFLRPTNKKKNNYSDWSILLHQIILDNYNISRSIFNIEKKRYLKKAGKKQQPFVIVTGLARAGTTALTKLLYETGGFFSLSYSNMPFLLGVNSWSKIYRPKNNSVRERAHGDRVMFGYNTVEALEEYFFKVQLRDSFIGENFLTEHEVGMNDYQEYLNYQKLIGYRNGQNTYLAKNNNLILRYESLRTLDPDFKVIMLFRNPEDHAHSLMKQHRRFSEMQKEDPFVLEYMNWLGHHEFGLNLKPFEIVGMSSYSGYDPDDINFWLISWINYYKKVLDLAGEHNLILIDYHDFLLDPALVLKMIGERLAIHMKPEEPEKFQQTNKKDITADPEILAHARKIYSELQGFKMKLG